VKYLVDANVLSEPTKPTPDPRVVAWLRADKPFAFLIGIFALNEAK
jgi:predicted nucleic acid-binding protein